MSFLSLYCRLRLLGKHKLIPKYVLSPPDSVVIPFHGDDYIDEAILCSEFASRHVKELKEVIIVSDTELNLSTLEKLEERVKYKKIKITYNGPENHNYKKIFLSRLCKIQCSQFASYEKVLVIDSDLLLLQTPKLFWPKNGVSGSFRKGSMIAKFKQSGYKIKPSSLKNTFRPYIKEHLNGAFMAAKKTIWSKLSDKWMEYYLDIWTKLPDNQPPTDQLPLTCALDHLNLKTFDAGNWVNWPVSKKIGGKPFAIPPEVIGAHGGFPLSEWRKYIEDKQAKLLFKGDDYTRKVRYLEDRKKIT